MDRILGDGYTDALRVWASGHTICASKALREIAEDLEKLPELVRCKDCKHWKDDLMRDDLHICEIGYYFIEENGYCSYGERRTDNG